MNRLDLDLGDRSYPVFFRSGAAAELAALVDGRWRDRDDHGAQDRLEVPNRGPSAQATELRAKPHLGMHTKGG